MEQLALDLGLPFEPPETVVSRCNEGAYALIESWPRWPHPVMLVRGPKGSGKTHLARTFARIANGRLVEGSALSAEQAVELASAPIALDDGEAADERALFHLINAVRSAGTTLLITAPARPLSSLADLASRLRAVPEVALGSPDDALLRRVIIDGFVQRQLPVEPKVVQFLMSQMERTLNDAVRLVEAIDRRALAERRGPSRPLAAQVLRAETGSR